MSGGTKFTYMTGEHANYVCVHGIVELMNQTPPSTKIEVGWVVSALLSMVEVTEGENLDNTFEIHKLEEKSKRDLFVGTIGMVVNAMVLEVLQRAREVAQKEKEKTNG